MLEFIGLGVLDFLYFLCKMLFGSAIFFAVFDTFLKKKLALLVHILEQQNKTKPKSPFSQN